MSIKTQATSGEIIARDVGMTAKILQVANSAFFGLQAQVANPTEAVLLLGLWGFLFPILEVVAFHHQPAASGGGHFSALTAIHVANVLERSAGPSEDFPAQIDYVHIAALGLCERLAVWQKMIQRQPAEGDRPPLHERNALRR